MISATQLKKALESLPANSRHRKHGDRVRVPLLSASRALPVKAPYIPTLTMEIEELEFIFSIISGGRQHSLVR